MRFKPIYTRFYAYTESIRIVLLKYKKFVFFCRKTPQKSKKTLCSNKSSNKIEIFRAEAEVIFTVIDGSIIFIAIESL